MQAGDRPLSDRRLRALAALLTCLLGLTLVATVHPAQGHRHPAHGIAIVATATADFQHVTSRSDHGTLDTTAATTAAQLRWPGTADSSTSGSPRTAHTPPVRGPPAQALA